MVYYEGLFFDGEDLEKILSLEEEKLDYINDVIHCTFKYRPSEVELFDELVGKTFDVDLIGYASDGKNSGFLIAFQDELKDYYINRDENGEFVTSHITCSLSYGAQSSDTKNLDFKWYKKPIRIHGKFGYYIKGDNGKTYVSYKKFKSMK